MKLTLIATTLLAALVASADIFPPGYRSMSKNRRVCVGREIIVVGGVTNIVTRWNRDGRPDWILPSVETNAIKRMKGAKQNNPIENARQEAEAEAAPAKAIKAATKNAAKKDLKNLQNAIKDLKKARDKSSDEMKAVYDPIIGLLEAEVN